MSFMPRATIFNDLRLLQWLAIFYLECFDHTLVILPEEKPLIAGSSCL